MVVVIDYDMGNLFSVKNALEAIGAEVVISKNPEDLKKASQIILPGVGAFPDGMKNLKELGIIPALEEEVLKKKKPFLGICLGSQLLASEGEEHGLTPGLGWIRGRVRRFKVDERQFRVPHIGWNDVSPVSESTLFKGIDSNIFYFVHSYFIVPENPEVVSATCDYGEKFTVAMEKGNIFGVQFHPEKSQKSGLKLLKKFLNL